MGYRLLAAALLTVLASAQQPTKQLDIGAAQAPLSDRDRIELAAAVAKHDYAAERAVIDRASKAAPMSADLMVMDGRLSYLEKHPKEAATALERADHVKPLADTDRLTLAMSYQFSKRTAQARTELLKLTRANPKNADYLYMLGLADRETKHLEEAIVSFRKATELNQGLMRAYEEMGQCQEALGLAEEAKHTYALGAFRNRYQTTRWEWSPVDYGAFLLKEGDLDEAEKLFRESLQYNPRFAWGHYYLGQVFQKREKHNEAVSEYTAALVHDRNLRQAWLGLGREYTRLGRTAEAERALAAFKRLEEQDSAVRAGKP